MKYHIHFGRLFPADQNTSKDCLCYIKQPVYSQNKQICSFDDTREVSVEIEEVRDNTETGDTTCTDRSTGITINTPSKKHRYMIKDPAGKLLAEGSPGYTPAADLPFSRGTRADHIDITLPDMTCRLQMQNSQNFILTLPDGHKMMELIHNGVSGGWNICADDSLDTMLVMGIFLFSRYLEKENEFVVV